MALDTGYGGRLYISGPIRECIKVVARAGAAQMMGVIRCFLTDTRADPGRPPGPLDGVLALLDVLLRRATLIVEGCGHIGDGLIYATVGDSDVYLHHMGPWMRTIITGCRKR